MIKHSFWHLRKSFVAFSSHSLSFCVAEHGQESSSTRTILSGRRLSRYQLQTKSRKLASSSRMPHTLVRTVTQDYALCSSQTWDMSAGTVPIRYVSQSIHSYPYSLAPVLGYQSLLMEKVALFKPRRLALLVCILACDYKILS